MDREGSLVLYGTYTDLRNRASAVPRLPDDQLSLVQTEVEGWITGQNLLGNTPDDYTHYSMGTARRKIGGLAAFLEQEFRGQVTSEEIEASYLFLDTVFKTYGDRSAGIPRAETADSSFAFIVPPRMSRQDPDYGQEVEPVIPVLRYVPNKLRAMMMVGLPPFVIDMYQPNAASESGSLILAPVFRDMLEGMSESEYIKAARWHINNAVHFAERSRGARTIGIGASLPSLTFYGKRIDAHPSTIITNGHAGTIELLRQTVLHLFDKEYASTKSTIGFVGLGAIGFSMVDIIAHELPGNPMVVFDVVDQRINTVLKWASEQEHNAQITATTSDRQLIEESDIIISAVSGKISLNGVRKGGLEGKIFIDDSQPGSVDPDQVADLGGNVVWVLGSDKRGEIQRIGYDYGTLNNAQTDFFGCEIETASLARYIYELQSSGRSDAEELARGLAVRQRVNPKNARRTRGLFKDQSIGIAPLQAFGKLVHLPRI